MPPIQHGPDRTRVHPGNGPRLHLSMYPQFVTADDDSAARPREPGRVIEGSMP